MGCDPLAWLAAAEALVELHRKEPAIPVDPELFVACQATPGRGRAPWPVPPPRVAVLRYRRRVRRIVADLRRELRQELRRAGVRLAAGEPLGVVLRSGRQQLSPLGRYILAHRANRADLLERLRRPAEDQHRACPLYRQACRGLLSEQVYPVFELAPGVEILGRPGRGAPQFSVN